MSLNSPDLRNIENDIPNHMQRFVSTGVGSIPHLQEKQKKDTSEKEELQGRRTPRSEIGDQKEELFIPLKPDGKLTGKIKQTT